MPDVTRPPDTLFTARAAMAIFWTSGGRARNAETIVCIARPVIWSPPAIALKSTPWSEPAIFSKPPAILVANSSIRCGLFVRNSLNFAMSGVIFGRSAEPIVMPASFASARRRSIW
jgi:hypothetical protein